MSAPSYLVIGGSIPCEAELLFHALDARYGILTGMDLEAYDITLKEHDWILAYLSNGMNAESAGTDTGFRRGAGKNLLAKPTVQAALAAVHKELSSARAMSAQEAVESMSVLARSSMRDLYTFEIVDDVLYARQKAPTPEVAECIQEIELGPGGQVIKMKMYDRKDAQDKMLRIHGKYIKKINDPDTASKELGYEDIDDVYAGMKEITDKVEKMQPRIVGDANVSEVEGGDVVEREVRPVRIHDGASEPEAGHGEDGSDECEVVVPEE